MPYLIESQEWHLIQTLGGCLEGRKAHNKPVGITSRLDIYHKLCEVELRQIFVGKEFGLELSDDVFNECRTRLRRLCETLNSLVDDRFIPLEGEESNAHYSLLSKLVHFLRAQNRASSVDAFDLIYGSHQTLFCLPQSLEEVKEVIKVCEEWNEFSLQLVSPFIEQSDVPAKLVKDGNPWSETKTRKHALQTFSAIFRHITCGSEHELMLRLSTAPPVGGLTPRLHLLLQCCQAAGQWAEAFCDNEYNEKLRDVCQVNNVCQQLHTHIGNDRAMRLLVKQYGLFCGRTDEAADSRQFSILDRKSLGVLIDDGVFLPRDPNYLLGNQTLNRYTLREKRALAMQLGYCLMDFFDHNLTPDAIGFFSQDTDEGQTYGPYLSFSSTPPPPSLRIFELGHPVLLSFAKLLLEIDCGATVKTSLTLQHTENAQGWFDLTRCVDSLEKERNDSYLQAIRGCLNVHHQIAIKIQGKPSSQEDDDLVIRNAIYRHIVRKLELGLEECTPRRADKRARSESPPLPPATSAHAGSTPSAAERTVKLPKRSNGPSHHTNASFARDHTLRTLLEENHPPTTRVHPDVESYQFEQTGTKLNYTKPKLLTRTPNALFIARYIHRHNMEIAIMCALPLEVDAVTYIFDELWDTSSNLGRAIGDSNSYFGGRIGNFNVILTQLPHIGKASAASVAASMRSSFPNLKLALLVGICGGIPEGSKREMLLGDVVISKTIVQYDFGRRYSNRFLKKSTITDGTGHPSKVIKSLVATFETDWMIDRLEGGTHHHLQQLQTKVDNTKRSGKYEYPGVSKDRLFQSTYRHKYQTCSCGEDTDDGCSSCMQAMLLSCQEVGCSDEFLVPRPRLEEIMVAERLDDSDNRTKWRPALHVGAVGSGDSVIKSARDREELWKNEGVIALEMEGAGIWNEMPCIVVKGVSDYADSHKDKAWQNFAAATAASAAKAIIERYTPTDDHL